MVKQSPFAVDWFDGTDWYNKVYCPTLKKALVGATIELQHAMIRSPEEVHVLRVTGNNVYVVLASNPEMVRLQS